MDKIKNILDTIYSSNNRMIYFYIIMTIVALTFIILIIMTIKDEKKKVVSDDKNLNVVTKNIEDKKEEEDLELPKTREDATITSEEFKERLNSLNLSFLCIQISIDSIYPDIHNAFRKYPKAFEKCEEILDKIKKYENINSSIRMTVTKDTLDQVDKMIDFAISKNCKFLGLGSVIPFGNASNGELSFTKNDKKNFMELVSQKSKKYNDKIQIVTEDPLKFLNQYENNSLNLKINIMDSCLFGGCTAGISSININSDGVITPCSMMEEKILDINDYDNVYDLIKAYQDSSIVKKLFSKKYNGICGKCNLNRICGGCRAVAKAYRGDIMGSDLSCWRYM